jgi:hypothetical protein
VIEADDRLERLLILLLLQQMKGATQRERVKQLNMVGLTNSEIAEYLETSPQVVATYVYEGKKGKKAKKPKPRPKK